MISCHSNSENGLSKLKDTFERYAVYFSPKPETALAEFGDNWLKSAPDGLVESPRRYGFHATLKAPMRLATGVDFKLFRDDVEKLAATLKPIELGILKLAAIGSFLALTTDNEFHASISEIAFACTTKLDHCRAPLNESERNKRKNLSAEQQAYLEKWGYPYVGDAFRFHMTLTSSLAQEDQAMAADMLKDRVPDEPTQLDSICIFGDPGSLRPFEFVERFDLTG